MSHYKSNEASFWGLDHKNKVNGQKTTNNDIHYCLMCFYERIL